MIRNIQRLLPPSELYKVIRLTVVGKGRIELGSGFQFRWHGTDDDSVWCFFKHYLNLCHVTCKRMSKSFNSS